MGQIKNIKLHIVTDIKVHIENKIPSRWSTFPHPCKYLVARKRLQLLPIANEVSVSSRSTEDLWISSNLRPEDEGPRTSPHRRKGTFCRYRHQSECERWWAGCTDVCDSSSDLEGNRRLLPEVRR